MLHKAKGSFFLWEKKGEGSFDETNLRAYHGSSSNHLQGKKNNSESVGGSLVRNMFDEGADINVHLTGRTGRLILIPS
jgi:hypothetical protein